VLELGISFENKKSVPQIAAVAVQDFSVFSMVGRGFIGWFVMEIVIVLLCRFNF
jgi:hypothetical protein